ncbi:MAG: DUF6635 family protein, partial [Qingshengfaniella sp.]
CARLRATSTAPGPVMITPPPQPTRKARIRAFVRETYGIGGTLRLHRAALGLDLLRAPVNVVLAPIYVLTRLAALILRLAGMRRAADWLAARQVLLITRVSQVVAERLIGFLRDLEAEGLAPATPPLTTARLVADYATIRNAVAEITTALIVLGLGLGMFHAATPGVISLIWPVADMLAQNAAVAGFPLGERLGTLWYGIFPARLSLTELVATGLTLAAGASIVTTFAGLIADPLQVLTGTHRRRLMRLLARLEATDSREEGLAREHLAARAGDMTDLALSLWRILRG